MPDQTPTVGMDRKLAATMFPTIGGFRRHTKGSAAYLGIVVYRGARLVGTRGRP